MANKQELRDNIAELKKQYSFRQKQQKSEAVFDILENNNDEFKKAKFILSYWSMADEVNTHDFNIKWAKSKRILLPVIKGDTLVLKEFEGVDKMKEFGSYKILEPTGNEFLDYKKIDLVIVPGIAFDKHKNRLGRGKAFYDKLLTKIKAPKIGVCFDFQIVGTVPTEDHDFKLDRIIFA